MINYLVPTNEILEVAATTAAALTAKGVTEREHVNHVLAVFSRNSDRFAAKGLDFWLGFGGYLPAVELIISKQQGETEQQFYARTEYPSHIVEAYSVPDNDFATLLAADQYMQYHRDIVPVFNTVWSLNEEQGHYLDLAQFENRKSSLPKL